MAYYFSRTVEMSFEDAVDRTRVELQREGFGIMSEIDVTGTLKKKLDVDFKRYLILGACHPELAYKALQCEAMIGTMMPCNVVLQEAGEGRTEITVVDPVASTYAIDNQELKDIVKDVQIKLVSVMRSV